MISFKKFIAEKKVPHALDPNKSLKHAFSDRMFDKDTDGDTDKFDKNTPDEITGDEKPNQTPKMLKKYAGEKQHTKKGVAYEEKDPRLDRAGVEGFNKAKRTPSHPTKSHIVVAKDGDKVKTIRFGEQGASTAGEPKKGESDKMKAKRKSFKARHGKNIAKGKMSAAYWADKEKW